MDTKSGSRVADDDGDNAQKKPRRQSDATVTEGGTPDEDAILRAELLADASRGAMQCS